MYAALERMGEEERVAIQYLFHSVLSSAVSAADLKYEMSSWEDFVVCRGVEWAVEWAWSGSRVVVGW